MHRCTLHSFALYTFLALLSLDNAIADSDIENGIISDANIKSGVNTHTGIISDANIKNGIATKIIEDANIITGITEDEWTIPLVQELPGVSRREAEDADNENCLACSDTGTPWMIKNGYSCVSPEVQGMMESKKCSTNATPPGNAAWTRKKFCEKTCFDIGRGYSETPCCTTPPPSCLECKDIPTPWLQNRGRLCTSIADTTLKKKCGTNGWKKRKSCEESCSRVGKGYSETPCCSDQPDPTTETPTETPYSQPTETPSSQPTETPTDPTTKAPTDPTTEAPTDPTTDTPTDPTTAAPRPNVMLILADDVGMGDISFYNPDAKDKYGEPLTPNIDGLVPKGTYFTDFHSMPLCAPSRRTLLSGRYPHGEVWSIKQDKSSLKSTDQSLPTLLKDSGYATAFFGKGHLGGKIPPQGCENKNKLLSDSRHDWTQPFQLGAQYLGFDTSYMAAGGIQNPPYAYFENDMLDMRNGTFDVVNFAELGRETILGDSFFQAGAGEGLPYWDSTSFGVDMIEKTKTFLDARDENQPFFIYYASEAVHVPHTPPEFFYDDEVKGVTRSAHLDMVRNLDLQVKALLFELDNRGLRESTIVMFVSDNGGLGAAPTAAVGKVNNCKYGTPDHDVSLGMRDCKGTVYEGGHRVPAIVSWPGHVKENHKLDDLTGINDVFRSVAEMAGVPVSSDQAPDSVSFFPRMHAHSPGETPARDSLYIPKHGNRNGGSMIRFGKMKLIRIFGRANDECAYELYDLESDPSESENESTGISFEVYDDINLVKQMAAEMDRLELQAFARDESVRKSPKITFGQALKV